MTLTERFSRCVKKLTKNFRSKRRMTRKQKEGAAIAICTKSILWPQGLTLRHFSVQRGKPLLITQRRFR